MRPALLALLLAGCTTASPTFTADGKPGHAITCSGTANSWASCYQKAGEICGSSGYTVQDKSGDQGFVAGLSTTGGAASSTISRSMIVQCK